LEITQHGIEAAAHKEEKQIFYYFDVIENCLPKDPKDKVKIVPHFRVTPTAVEEVFSLRQISALLNKFIISFLV
jgi:hypothetical protein